MSTTPGKASTTSVTPVTMVMDKNGTQQEVAAITMPDNRSFRKAWALNGAVMQVDMAAARELFKEHAEAARGSMMEGKILEEFITAQLSGNPATVAAFATKFQAMKDGISDQQLAAAATPDALSALWDANAALLGTNPFSTRAAADPFA